MNRFLPKVMVGALLVLLGGFLAAKAQAAGTLTSMSVTLNNPTEDATNVYHTVTFKTDSTATTKYVNFQYCKTPSGSCTPPANLTTSAATKGDLTNFGDTANWTLDATVDDVPKLGSTINGQSINADTQLTVEMRNITNNSIAGTAADCQNDGELSSDTCYIRVTTIDNASVDIDLGTVSYTVVNAVTVTATVDPSFTFVVTGVNQGAVNNGITASVNSTYSTLPFGNLTVGVPRYAAHQLNVTTNTQNGYYIYMRMSAQMTGVYTSNNIDPFAGGGTTWGAPVAWVEPTGTTPNDNTGWIGANTTDTDVTGWDSLPSGKFGPVNSNTTNAVMRQANSDNGSVPIYVTYAIESNVFQPADTYTGTILYTAVPTY